MIEVSIQCNHCTKKVTWEFSETVTIDILPVLIKSVVFLHVGLSLIILNKDKYELSVEIFLNELQDDHGLAGGGVWT